MQPENLFVFALIFSISLIVLGSGAVSQITMFATASLDTNLPPNNAVPSINTSDGSNTPGKQVNCYAVVTDPDGDRLNVSFRWYKNGVLQYTVGYLSSYASGSLVKTSYLTTLDGDVMKCSLRAFDGLAYSNWTESAELRISGINPICYDGTLYSQCSVTKPKYCFNGVLRDFCGICACPSGYSCNASSGSCYNSSIAQPATQTCSDGTPYGACSVTKPRYCDSGALINRCAACGCPAGYSCNSTSYACYIPTVINQATDQTNNLTIVAVCSDGTEYDRCSAAKPKYCSNGTLIDKCASCGCPSAYGCAALSGSCVTASETSQTPSGGAFTRVSVGGGTPESSPTAMGNFIDSAGKLNVMPIAGERSNSYIIEFKEIPALTKENQLREEVTGLRQLADLTQEQAKNLMGLKRIAKISESSYLKNIAVTKEREITAEVLGQYRKVSSEQASAVKDIDSRVKYKSTFKFNSFYKGAFNGVAVNISESDVSGLRQSPYVKAIYQDKVATIDLMDSVPLINADDVWQLVDGNGQKVTGKGVTIAIIDTGTDYTNPELGGCFGTGCKVIGGYDFVNGDADPMDDQGHGTHVAATAAGNGVLKGVAPDANILSYKVCNPMGQCSYSAILAAIERAMDPNSDGDYSDHADVISMSLGGPGDPDDTISMASDAAVDIGVVVVVAAGNSGPASETIGSPGTARKVITIAASSKQDQITDFSSRGPVIWPGGSLVKPDVAAPGLYICAAQWDSAWNTAKCLDDKHVAISGTSMATPHVAGAAALLIQAHPAWTPVEIKAVLMNKAKLLTTGDTSVYAQGSGRIDVLAAAGTPDADVPPIAELLTGGKVHGLVDVSGTATGTSFSRWVLYYGEGSRPTAWTEAGSGTERVENGILLHGWDTSSLAEYSEHSFKLVVFGTNGQNSTRQTLVTVENIIHELPLPADIYRGGEKVNITGTIWLPTTKVDLYYKSSEGAWIFSSTSYPKDQTEHETLATWDTAGLPTGNYTLNVSILLANGRSHTYLVSNIYIDTTLKQGWPVRIARYSYSGMMRPIVYDINNDQKKEIIILGGGDAVTLLIYNDKGEPLISKTLGNPVGGYNLPMPIVGDIDNDGYGEVIVYNMNTPGWYPFLPDDSQRATLYAVNHDGTMLWEAMIVLDTLPTLSMADLNRDGNKEIIFHGSNGISTRDYVINGIDGKVISTWKTNDERVYIDSILDYWQLYPHVTVGNFDDDPELELISIKNTYDGNPAIAVHNMDGTMVDGWPIRLGSLIASSPAVGDINNDGKDEIIIGLIQGGGGLYALDRYGKNVTGWPIMLKNYFSGSPALMDIDGDGYLEIANSDTVGRVFLIDHDGKVLSNWPKPIGRLDVFSPAMIESGGSALIHEALYTGAYSWDKAGLLLPGFLKVTENYARGPVIDDIDNDGKLEAVATSNRDINSITKWTKSRTSVYVWETDLAYDASKMYWPTFLHDTMNTGYYSYKDVLAGQTCSGTPYGQCVAGNPPKYCSAGTIVDDCLTCGCPVTQICVPETKSCRTPAAGERIEVFYDEFNDLSAWKGNISTTSGDYKKWNYGSTSVWVPETGWIKVAYNGTYEAMASPSNIPLSINTSVSTAYYSNIWVSLGVKTKHPTGNLEDYLKMDWFNGTAWNNLLYFHNASNYTYAEYSLPPAASKNANFAIRLSCKNTQDISLPADCFADSLRVIGNYVPSDAPVCYDGTAYGQCSSTIGKYCDNGQLVDKCTVCGCPPSQSCNDTTNACYTPVPPQLPNYPPLTPFTSLRSGSGLNTTSDDLKCSATITDPEGGRMNVSVQWYKNDGSNTIKLYNNNYASGSNFEGELLAGNLSAGDVWKCGIRLYDGNSYSDWGVSNTVAIVSPAPPNSIPRISILVLVSTFGTNTTKEDLTCSGKADDADGDVMNATIKWYKNLNLQLVSQYNGLSSGSTFSAAIKSGNLTAGDVWRCAAVLTDGKANSTVVQSNTLTVLSAPLPGVNTPPNTPQPSLVSYDGSNTVSSDLLCYDTIADIDGDRMNATVQWFKNGKLNSTKVYNNNYPNLYNFNVSLAKANLTLADVWLCGIRLYDGKAYSAWGNSSPLAVVSPPALPIAQPPASGGGGGGGGGWTPLAATAAATTPAQADVACVNRLEVTMPEEIFIPQQVTKQVSVIVKNVGTCPVASVSAMLSLPPGMTANSYVLESGLDVNESQTIGFTVMPTDAPAGMYSATLMLDAPNVTLSKITRVRLLENPPYVVSQEGPSAPRIFEYIIALILMEFVFGAIVMTVWYRPPQERLPPLPQIGSDLKPIRESPQY